MILCPSTPDASSRRRAITGASALSLIALSLVLLSSCARSTPGKPADDKLRAAPARARVKIVSVEEQRQQRTVEAVGSLFAFDEVTVSSEAEGRVEQVMVDVGDRVTRGQVLARISPVEMELSVEQQRAALRQARARLGLGEEEGELRDVRQAAEVKKAAADLADAEQKYRRAESLLKTGVIAQQVYDEAESRYKAARAAYDLAVQQVENLRASMQQTQATLNLANKRLRDAQIRAPFAGQVKARAVTTGQYLKVQTPVMTIVNVDPLRVRLNVPEKMSPWVRVGRDVKITLEAFPGREFTGRISRINPAVEEKTRTFEIEALVANHGGELKPGSFVKATLQSDKVDPILTIPQNSAVYLFGAYKVFVVQGRTVKEREVKLGDHFGDRVEVIEGLQAEDKVAVSDSSQPLKDGMEIEIEK
ncbi:MAG TPA: efflux RND transporter periplasmic adaptor subunit [Blastocatellia bacterium]|nr:efflux RND transporter periplasmic adaptor subunit [Blastocatellia bacterium]